MHGPFLLGLDSGSSTTKAIIFDAAGRIAGAGRTTLAARHPAPRHVVRDMDAVWEAARTAIVAAIADAAIDAGDIAAIGVTGHGDGLYLLDRAGAPLGTGMLSLDSRALEVVAGWSRSGTFDAALPLTGQRPYPYAAVSLLAWIKRHEPERYAAIGSVLFCKDWLRYRLTGTLATDITEASTSFTELHSQAYSQAVLDLFDLAEIGPALPAMAEPHEVVGRITAQAAQSTGLRAGTPVVAGLHDVTASAVGSGNIAPGMLTVTAGTFSINEVLSDRPVTDPRWSCRAGLTRGSWMAMSISPASSSNFDWFVRQLCPAETTAATAAGRSVLDALLPEIERAFAGDSAIVFHPYLYGSPFELPASASFLGLQGWHTRGDMLRALLEGVVFNHRTHIDALLSRLPADATRITGGGSSMPLMASLFADGLGRAVEIPATQEAAALGAALCAASGAGVYPDLAAATSACCRIARRYAPDPARARELEARYHRYARLIEALKPVWDDFAGEPC